VHGGSRRNHLPKVAGTLIKTAFFSPIRFLPKVIHGQFAQRYYALKSANRRHDEDEHTHHHSPVIELDQAIHG